MQYHKIFLGFICFFPSCVYGMQRVVSLAGQRVGAAIIASQFGQQMRHACNFKSSCPYKVLDATTGMSLEEIKKKYYEAARQTHPDAGGNSADFRAVHDAWEKIQHNGCNQSSSQKTQKASESQSNHGFATSSGYSSQSSHGFESEENSYKHKDGQQKSSRQDKGDFYEQARVFFARIAKDYNLNYNYFGAGGLAYFLLIRSSNYSLAEKSDAHWHEWRDEIKKTVCFQKSSCCYKDTGAMGLKWHCYRLWWRTLWPWNQTDQMLEAYNKVNKIYNYIAMNECAVKFLTIQNRYAKIIRVADIYLVSEVRKLASFFDVYPLVHFVHAIRCEIGSLQSMLHFMQTHSDLVGRNDCGHVQKYLMQLNNVEQKIRNSWEYRLEKARKYREDMERARKASKNKKH